MLSRSLREADSVWGFHPSGLGKIITGHSGVSLEDSKPQSGSQSVTERGQVATAEPAVREGSLKRLSVDVTIKEEPGTYKWLVQRLWDNDQLLSSIGKSWHC